MGGQDAGEEMTEPDDQSTEAMAEHIVRNQIEPALAADAMQRQGLDVETALVTTDVSAEAAAEWFIVTCLGCGRTARTPSDPGVRVALCPRCLRDADGLAQ
jgi:hypothetical protein